MKLSEGIMESVQAHDTVALEPAHQSQTYVKTL